MSFTKKALGLALLALNDLNQVNAGIWFGQCPAQTNQANIDLNSYTGTWYEYTRDFGFAFETATSCTTATYTAINSTSINVVNRSYYWPLTFTANWITANGKGNCNSAAGSCSVGFPQPKSSDVNYNILYTDYSNVSVVYSCSNLLWGTMYWDYLWVLSRTPKMTDTNYK